MLQSIGLVNLCLKGCSTVQNIVIEIGKPCSTMQKFVIEIYMEQTWLFQCNWFHYADFCDWNRDWIFQNEQRSFWKILTEISKKINHRMNTAILYLTGSTVQKIGRAAQVDFFQEVGGAYEYLCRARAVNDEITSICSLLRRSWQMQHVQQRHSYIRHHYLRPLVSSAKQNILSLTSILHHCQSRNTWPRLMNINFQSRFSAQWNTPFTLNTTCRSIPKHSHEFEIS